MNQNIKWDKDKRMWLATYVYKKDGKIVKKLTKHFSSKFNAETWITQLDLGLITE